MNENIFETIDTKEKAYWLGFIYADGNISKKGNRVGFCLASKDSEILYKFSKFIQDENPQIKSYKNPKVVYYYLYSKKLKYDLMICNIFPDKTHRIEFPIINQHELFLAFLLGFYDGDGGKNSLSCNNLDFLKHICDRMNIEESKIRFEYNMYGSCYKLYIQSNNMKLLFDNYKNSLERKRKTAIYFPGDDYQILDVDIEFLKNELKNKSINDVSKELNIELHLLKYHINKYPQK